MADRSSHPRPRAAKWVTLTTLLAPPLAVIGVGFFVEVATTGGRATEGPWAWFRASLSLPALVALFLSFRHRLGTVPGGGRSAALSLTLVYGGAPALAFSLLQIAQSLPVEPLALAVGLSVFIGCQWSAWWPIVVIGLRKNVAPVPAEVASIIHQLERLSGVRAPRILCLRPNDRDPERDGASDPTNGPERDYNAMVVGVGRFRTVLITSELIEDHGADVISSVLAHEFAHVRLRHVEKALLAGTLFAAAVIWVGHLVHPIESFVHRALLVGGATVAAGLCCVVASRAHERSADRWASRWIDPDAVAAGHRAVHDGDAPRIRGGTAGFP